MNIEYVVSNLLWLRSMRIRMKVDPLPGHIDRYIFI